MVDRKMAPKSIVNQNYFDKKIKELRDCFGEQQKEFESAIYKLKVEVKSVDNVESQGGLKQPNFSKMDKSKLQKHTTTNKLEEHCKVAKQELELQLRKSCSFQIQSLNCEISRNNGQTTMMKEDAPRSREVKEALKDLLKIKGKQKQNLNRMVEVTSKMAPIKSDLHGELRKQNLALEDQLTKLIQDNHENKDQVQVLSTIKKSKNKKQ